MPNALLTRVAASLHQQAEVTARISYDKADSDTHALALAILSLSKHLVTAVEHQRHHLGD
jgi:hypothetical protein